MWFCITSSDFWFWITFLVVLDHILVIKLFRITFWEIPSISRPDSIQVILANSEWFLICDHFLDIFGTRTLLGWICITSSDFWFWITFSVVSDNINDSQIVSSGFLLLSNKNFNHMVFNSWLQVKQFFLNTNFFITFKNSSNTIVYIPNSYFDQ